MRCSGRGAPDVPVPRPGRRGGDRGRGCAGGLPLAGSFDPAAALGRYEQVRRPRATRIQELSRGRQETNHLPDGPAQQARDAALAGQDPLTHNDWIYRYDAELAERQPTAASPDAEADAAGQD